MYLRISLEENKLIHITLRHWLKTNATARKLDADSKRFVSDLIRRLITARYLTCGGNRPMITQNVKFVKCRRFRDTSNGGQNDT